MTFEELKKDKRLQKLMVLMPAIWIDNGNICANHFNLAGENTWYSCARSYQGYKDFYFNEFALSLIKYSNYGRQIS